MSDLPASTDPGPDPRRMSKDYHPATLDPQASAGRIVDANALPLENPRVLIVSDLRLYRDYVALHLVQDGTTVLVGAATVAEAIPEVLAVWPDVLLLDAAAAGALQLPRALKAYQPDLRIIACAVPREAQESLAWVEAGAAGWVSEDATSVELVASVHRVWRDEVCCPPALVQLMVRRIGDLADERQQAGALSIKALGERERQVLGLVAEGASHKDIARKLGLQPATVKNYVLRIVKKLNAESCDEQRLLLRG